MAQISDPVKLIHLYQKSLEKHCSTMDVKKLTYYIGKLNKMPITVKHLQDTGIGRTVNSLRKLENEAGDAARSLVMKWKEMVLKEGSLPGSNDSDRDEEEEEDEDDDDDEDENSEDEIESSQSRTDIKSKEHERSSSKEKSSSSRNDVKSLMHEKTSGKCNGNSDYNRKHKSKHSDSGSENECNVIKHHSKSESSSGKHKHHNSTTKSRHERSDKDKHNSKHESKTESKHKSGDKRSNSHSSKRKHEHDSCDDTELKRNKTEKEKYKKFESDISSDETVSKQHKADKKKSKKHTSDDSSSNEDEQKYENKGYRKHDSDDSHSETETKYKSEKRRHNKHESDYSDDSETKKHRTDERKKHSSKRKHDSEDESKSKREKTESKNKEQSKKHEKHSRSHKSDEHRKSDKRDKEKSSSKGSDKEKPSTSDKRSQKETEKKKNEKERTSKSRSESKHKKSSLNSNEDGIDCGSGASFAEALGMLEPAPSKISIVKKKTTSTPKPVVEETKESPTTSKILNNVPPPLVEPPSKLEPVDINISSLLPTITPNYRPLGILNEQTPRTNKVFSDEALANVMSSKNQRTKVYSGNKSTWNKVPSLFEICVRVLQDNMDAFEYTGGVPYSLLKPVLEKATPDQLFMMEHHNPYLIEDTDELWYLHCQKEFKNKKREELETWREMYMRCLDEREARLKALTANIKMSQDKSTPVRQTKLAYVDNYVKPPRQIAKKQAKNGIVVDKTPSVTATSKLNAIAASSSAGQITVPNPGTRAVERRSGGSSSMIKPKKAPLMQKTLASMKNRFRR